MCTILVYMSTGTIREQLFISKATAAIYLAEQLIAGNDARARRGLEEFIEAADKLEEYDLEHRTGSHDPIWEDHDDE